MSPQPDPDGQVARALLAFVRAEFQAPVARLSGLLDILREDAAAAGLADYDADLARMQAAGTRLSGRIDDFLRRPALTSDTDEQTSALRHDLRTSVASILGYGELMAEEAREREDAAIFVPLADALDAAGRLLREIDRIVAFSSTARGGGDPRGTSRDLLRTAVEAVQHLARHEPVLGPSVVGRILVVDDNASMRDLVSRRLTRDGHTVTTASSGGAALDMTAQGLFDLMLLDLMMPGIDGLEVLKRCKGRTSTKAMPVIVISALDELDAAVRCIEAGADDFLSKPLNETLLRARIGSSLDRKFLRDREEDAVRRLKLEQERSERLLRNVLPAGIVERLRAGETAVADHFDEATVLFCDLVGFTALSARQKPAETLDLLNEIFSGFDQLAEENGLEKIKTIGDAYMVAGGIPDPVPDHARRVVTMAAGMPEVVARATRADQLRVRIGIDSGPAVAGIIGTQKFFYDVWGDTVNTASRLEASCEPGRIHVSAATRDAVSPAFAFEEQAPIEVRGKGQMQTYYLL
ncbi:adenylate/guanylate cyclase domain-containing protein [uncultured Enterovirga sp.]|uniref:adenylate/guanylate cyclase domain-containing protein n=1 Tax=uncultured Enterovirga sp. TaxID=2026352 RepID=UPI0035CACC34